MKFKLLMESQLLEDIAAVRKNYPKISDEDFDRLIRLDPTFNESRDSVGTYGKWILNLFNKGNLTNEGHLYDVLSRFEQEKKNLKNKDIGKFKSLEEVDKYLNDDDSYKELSHRQEVRGRQKDRKNADLGNEAEKVFETSEWEVWVPKTYAASCKLGQGSSWCTASTESDYYYKQYTRNGNLYININKSDPGEKYQFHFESASFMDIDDSSIYIMEFLEDKPELKKFYAPKLMESIGLNESDVDESGFVVSVISESDFSKAFGDDNDFIWDLVNGDASEHFDSDYYYSSFSTEYLPAYSEYPENLKSTLESAGIVDETSMEMAIDSDESIEWAFKLAYATACSTGSANMAYEDLVEALDDCNAKIVDGDLHIYMSLDDVLDSPYYEDYNYYDDIICANFRENFNFVEPRYGWSGFDEETFFEELLYRMGDLEG